MSTFITKGTSRQAQAYLEAMRERMRQGPASLLDLADAIGKSRYSAQNYLYFMRERNEVVCVQEATLQPGSSLPALWELNRNFTGAVVEDGVDRYERKVVVRKSGEWPPYHRRMPLDCYLFGVPAVLVQDANI